MLKLRAVLGVALGLCVLGVGTRAAAEDPPGEIYARAYLEAVEYLGAQGAEAWQGVEGQSVLLGEALAADPLVAGPRSTAALNALELASVDARARRARVLAGLGLHVSADTAALDYGLAIRALHAAGYGEDAAIAEASTNLMEFQRADGSWGFSRGGASGGTPAGDLGVTAQVVLALDPYEGTTFADLPSIYGLPFAPESVDGILAAATLYLQGAVAPNASQAALRFLALIERDPAWPGLSDAMDALLAYRRAKGSFADSAYATALAAQALLRASAEEAFAFDTDGDGIADGPEYNADGDLYCDPGEPDHPTGPDPCFATDAFPLDPAEHADFDGDGVGDEADPDDDGDGVADIDELLAGLDPTDVDTDADSFRDGTELAYGSDGADPSVFPPPDGDIHPLGNPDGSVDARDALLALRILRGGVVVAPGEEQLRFERHADVAPLDAGEPAPDGSFDAADGAVILRRVAGQVLAW